MNIVWLILGAIALTGIFLFIRSVNRTPDLTPGQVADIIERFTDGAEANPHEWDDYTCIPSRNPELEQIRRDCEAVATIFPPENISEWCNTAGMAELKRLATKARQLAQQPLSPPVVQGQNDS